MPCEGGWDGLHAAVACITQGSHPLKGQGREDREKGQPMTLTLVRFPDEVLKYAADPVVWEDFKDGAEALLAEMAALMEEHGGIGLAANQIGERQRFFAMKRESDASVGLIINPMVIGKRGMFTIETEGCLSLPGVSFKVGRWSTVTIQYLTFEGESQTTTFTGLDAEIVQHEMDHLAGVTIRDRATMSAQWPSVSARRGDRPVYRATPATSQSISQSTRRGQEKRGRTTPKTPRVVS